jgi:hypothetical protein
MSEPTGEAESWLTISEAASRLKLTPYGIRSRIRRGALRTKWFIRQVAPFQSCPKLEEP